MTRRPRLQPRPTYALIELPERQFNRLPARVRCALEAYHTDSWTDGVRTQIEVSEDRIPELLAMMDEELATVCPTCSTRSAGTRSPCSCDLAEA